MLVKGAISYGGVIAIFSLALFILRLWVSRRRTSVRGKVVLITGASSGVGEACAHVFYKAGAKVILCARREAELMRVKAELIASNATKHKNNIEPEVIILDLADLDSIPDIAERAIRIHGHVDILINNGGLSNRGSVMATALSVHAHLMQVNYLGTVAITKGILPSMLSTGYGHVVGVSSVQGKIAIPNRSAYAASKHAMQAFLDCLRSELSHKNIHVSVVSPGYIKTSLSLNALAADGTKHGVMDPTTASGMEPSEVACEILRAVTHQHKEIILAPRLHGIAVIIRNLFPSIYFKIMSNRARKERTIVSKTKSV